MSSVLRTRVALLARRTTTTTTTTPTTSSSRTSLSLTTPIRASYSSSPFQTGPAPPRLPADQQAEFERLQRTANTQEGFNPSSTPDDFVIPSTTPSTTPSSSSSSSATSDASAKEGTISTASGQGGVKGIVDDSIAPTPLRKGAPPEFEGEVNPKTGEVGGPKNEPLRWGAGGDYSYNGRVTDF